MRLTTAKRRRKFLEAGLTLAKRYGTLRGVRKLEFADEAECGPSNLCFHFGTMEAYRFEVAMYAIEKRDAKVCAILILAGHELCPFIDDQLRRAAAASILE